MQNQPKSKKLPKLRYTFSSKINIKKHLNETSLIEINSLTPRKPFLWS